MTKYALQGIIPQQKLVIYVILLYIMSGWGQKAKRI